MEIKPTGPPQFPAVSRTDETRNKTAFTGAEKSTAGEAISETGQPLGSLRAQFSKADLQDPAKLDIILSRAADELVRSTLTDVNGRLSQADSAYVSDWMRNDPTFRGKLLNYLQRVLT
jgi:hypothetical protein